MLSALEKSRSRLFMKDDGDDECSQEVGGGGDDECCQ